MRTSDWPIAVKQSDGTTAPTIFCFGRSETIDPGLNNPPQTSPLAENGAQAPVLFPPPDSSLFGVAVLVFCSVHQSLCAEYGCQLPPGLTNEYDHFKASFSRVNVSDGVRCSSLSGVCACVFRFLVFSEGDRRRRRMGKLNFHTWMYV